MCNPVENGWPHRWAVGPDTAETHRLRWDNRPGSYAIARWPKDREDDPPHDRECDKPVAKCFVLRLVDHHGRMRDGPSASESLAGPIKPGEPLLRLVQRKVSARLSLPRPTGRSNGCPGGFRGQGVGSLNG